MVRHASVVHHAQEHTTLLQMNNALDRITTAQQYSTRPWCDGGFGQGGQRSVQHGGVDFAFSQAKGI
jgi:hypothetical protein